MKAALIPPTKELRYFGNNSFHLLLSHLFQDPKYVQHYMQQRMRGAYLVLDNSAHEYSVGQDAAKLLQQAAGMRCQEMVVPDSLEDAEGTIEKALSAMEVWYEGDQAERMKELDPTLMYVPQGNDEKEWAECLKELIRIHMFTYRKRGARSNFVIGLSKDYEKWDGGLDNLLTKYLLPIKEDGIKHRIRIHVHLLGWGRDLWVLQDLAAKHFWIRSTDSAKPFVYALSGIDLSQYPVGCKDYPEYPSRPATYFEKRLTPAKRRIAYSNLSVFKGLAGDKSA